MSPTKNHKEIYFLEGGIGNQAAILSYAVERANDGAFVRLSSFKYRTKVEKRPMCLKAYFNFDSSFIDLSSRPYDFFMYYLIKIIKRFFYSKFDSITIMGHSFKVGYFQENMIQRLGLLRNFAIQPQNHDKYICIHLRRGDYLLPKHSNHGVIDIDSVKLVLNKISKKYQISVISIISEDTSVFQHFRNDYDFKHLNFLDHTHTEELEAFKIMLNAKVLVCSNSTFSLLAGVLSGSEFWIPMEWDKFNSSAFLGNADNVYPNKFLEF